MSTSATIEHLRDLFAQPASHKTWAAICQILDGVADDDPELPVVIDYVEEHASPMNQVHRVTPAKWAFEALDPAVDQVRLRVVRVIDLSEANKLYTMRRLEMGGAAAFPEPRELTAEGLKALASCPHLAELRELDLSKNRLQEEAGVALASCPPIPGLRKLNLYYNRLGEGGMAALVTSDFVRGLTHLNLALNGGERYGKQASALAETDALKNLEELKLDFGYYEAWEDMEWISLNEHLKDSIRRQLAGQAEDMRVYEEEYE